MNVFEGVGEKLFYLYIALSSFLNTNSIEKTIIEVLEHNFKIVLL